MLYLLAYLIWGFVIQTCCVSTKYDYCQQKATWNMAKEMCDVPSITELNSNKEQLDISEFMPNNEPVWTSNQVMSSDWAKFYGCIDIVLENNSTIYVAKLLNERYFQNETVTSVHATLQYCSYYCSGRGKHFVYLLNTCKCLIDIDLYRYGFHEKPTCPQACENTNSNLVFCSSGIGIPVFEFIKDLEQQITRSDHMTAIQQQCLKRGNNSKGIATDCTLTNPFTCKCRNNNDVQMGNWTSAVNWCLQNSSFIESDRLSNENENFWLGYFLLLNASYNERNRKCIALSTRKGNDNKRSISYQYRNCSDALHVVCKDKDSMVIKCIPVSANETVTITNHVNTMFADVGDVTTYGSTVQHNQSITTVVDLSSLDISKALKIIVSVVLFVLFLLVICLIIFSRRLKIALRQRRNTPDPHIVIHSNADSEAPAQIRLREIDADPWDMRENMAEIDGIYHEVSDRIAAEYCELNA